MRWLYDALNTRYATFPALVRIGQGLVRPDESEHGPNRVHPYVITTIELDERLDTFGHDVERYRVDFALAGKALQPDDADNWLVHMRRAFNLLPALALVVSNFYVIGSKMDRAASPSIASEAYDASCSLNLILGWYSGFPSRTT